MAPSAATAPGLEGTEIVRARLLTSLHVGRLEPGDRVPSVRRLADLTGLNRKTVHRAFQRLAREGLLDVRPGSGTFIAGRGGCGENAASSRDLVAAVGRMRATAAALQLPPRVFSSFVEAALGDGLAGTRVAVVECNREQAGMIETDLSRRLGLSPFRVLLSRLRAEGPRALQGANAVITTDCHLEEVAELSRRSALGVHSVSLDAEFPRKVIELSRREGVVLVVHDPGFGPVFFRLLRHLGLEEPALGRIRVVQSDEAESACRSLPHGGGVWLSPLVRESVAFSLPTNVRLVPGSWHVPAEFLERVRAELALEHACRQARPS